jgi:GntR family transcriptional repressor for pyruvate dehydrogenase complex
MSDKPARAPRQPQSPKSPKSPKSQAPIAPSREPARPGTPGRVPPGGLGSGTWFGFRPVRARKPYEEAIEQILDAIRGAQIHVGERLPSERVLADQMQISRPTLREAVKVLVEHDILDVRRGPAGGMFVVSEIIPPNFTSEPDDLRMTELAGVLEARRVLEPRVAQLAGLYATQDDFDAMSDAIEVVSSLPHDRHMLFQLDVRFHLTMARATRNETVVEFMRVLHRKREPARQLFTDSSEDAENMARLHTRTLDAIMSGVPEMIERAMDEHLAVLEHRWEERTGRPRLRQIPDFLLSDSD